MLIKYPGVCDWCGKKVEAGKGDFQSVGSLPKHIREKFTGKNYKGRWLIRCFNCKGRPNEDLLKRFNNK